MKSFFSHALTYIYRGLLAIIPMGLCYFVLRFLYVVIDQRIVRWIAKFVDVKLIPGLGILLLCVVLYFIGLITSNVLGKRMLNVIEKITKRIPLVKTVYQIGQQLSETLSLPEKQIFQKAVVVELRPDHWVPGFVTGKMVVVGKNNTKEEFLKVMVPHVPNPASGFIIVIKASLVRDPHWTVEEALKMVVSGGIIGPAQMII